MELLKVASVVAICSAAVVPKDGGDGGSAVPAPDGDGENCTLVSCVNNIAKLVMNKSQLEGRADCDHGLYDEENTFVCEANKSGVMYHSCQPVMYWKIVCDNKTMNVKACFRGVNDTRLDPTASSNVDSDNQLWLKILFPVLGIGIVIVIVIGFGIWKWWERRRHSRTFALPLNVLFSAVSKEVTVQR